jgi:hypothetical protein
MAQAIGEGWRNATPPPPGTVWGGDVNSWYTPERHTDWYDSSDWAKTVEPLLSRGSQTLHSLCSNSSQTLSITKEKGQLSRYNDCLRARRPKGPNSSPGRDKNFLFSMSSRPTLGPTQPPIQWLPRVLSRGVKRPGREADHSPPSNAEVKNTWRYTYTSPYGFMVSCLIKHSDVTYYYYYRLQTNCRMVAHSSCAGVATLHSSWSNSSHTLSNTGTSSTEDRVRGSRLSLPPPFPVRYLTTLSVARLYSVGWRDDSWLMKWEGFGRKRSLPNKGY